MQPLFDFIDPSIGTGIGQCPPGPFLPFGIAHPSPDCVEPMPTSGYAPGLPILRFSHLHVSGTGGGSRYGNVGLMPCVGPVGSEAPAQMPSAEKMSVGRYATTLEPSGIAVEVAATTHCGVHRYRFPAGAQAQVMIDGSAVLRTVNEVPEDTGRCVGGMLQRLPTGMFIGRGDFIGGYGHPYSYSIFYAIACSQTPTAVSFIGADGHLHEKTNYRMHGPIGQKNSVEGHVCKALCQFGDVGDGVVEVRVGISFVSVAKAREHLEQECGSESFEQVVTRAQAAWHACLGPVQVAGGDLRWREMMASMLYRLHTLPKDCGVDEENPSWTSGVRQFTDFYCLWDSARNAFGMMTLLKPQLAADWLNALLDIGDHIGWVPDSWISFQPAFVQGGNSADTCFGEGALKGLPGVDYARAAHFAARNAKTTSPDPFLYGRFQTIDDPQGYVSGEMPMASVSRHIEYTYQDWSLAALGKVSGQPELVAEGLAASERIWNLWRDDLHCFAPRSETGAWIEPFDPDEEGRGWRDPSYYEGSATLWSLHAFQDIPELIARHGGSDAFCQHLDDLFAKPRRDGGWYAKEFVLHAPWLYIHAGKPDRLATLIPDLLERFYNGGDHLPDDEDMGCQSSFVIGACCGFYPVMGQALWWLHTPRFQSIDMQVSDGKRVLCIRCDTDPLANPYIAGISIDGVALSRCWCTHAELANASELTFLLSEEPVGFGANQPPPSAKDQLQA